MTALQGWIVIGLLDHAWNSRPRRRDKIPAVRMAYRRAERRLGEMMAETDDKAGGLFLDGPGWREAAGGQRRYWSFPSGSS